jgi:hypothetical protein
MYNYDQAHVARPLLQGSDLAEVARILPNLADLEIYHARLYGACDAPLAALTTLRLERCSYQLGDAPLRLGGALAPRLRSVYAEAPDATCLSLVAGHPALRELEFGGRRATRRDAIYVFADSGLLRALTRLKLEAYLEEEDEGDYGAAGDIFLPGLLAATLRLPPSLRSLDVALVRGDAPERLDVLLATLGCAVGGGLRELSLVLKTVGAAEAASTRNPFMFLPAFPRLETLRLGCWHYDHDSCVRLAPQDALELLGPLVEPLAAARALAPSLRAVELVLSDLWEWGPAQDAGVAGLVRANPGLTVCHSADPFVL